MPGAVPGLEETARTKEQEKEQFLGREVGPGSRYGAPSSVLLPSASPSSMRHFLPPSILQAAKLLAMPVPEGLILP